MLLRYVAGCSKTDYFVIIVPLNRVENLSFECKAAEKGGEIRQIMV